MKKLLALMLVLAMAFCFAACGGGEEAAVDENPYLIEIADYTAEYTGYEIVKDSEGNDTLVCTYNFTNNGEEAQSFEWAWMYAYYQDGIELDYSVVFLSEDSFDCVDDATLTDIQPGNTLEVKTTYKLNSLESPVEVEFTDMYSDTTDGFTIELQ